MLNRVPPSNPLHPLPSRETQIKCDSSWSSLRMLPSNPSKTARKRDATEIPNCKRSVCSPQSHIRTPPSCSERNLKAKGDRHMKTINHKKLRALLLCGIVFTLGTTFIGCGGGGGSAPVQQQQPPAQQQPTFQPPPAAQATPQPTSPQNQSRTTINNRNTGSGPTTGAGTNGGYVPRARQQPSPSPTASNVNKGGYVPRARKP